ncbi:hypothetical protein DFA_03521 [Cavenderia fasciculata]|uniref:Methyltransferase n=1 Tax=Cavenderia fasciculata TaxID=261658 RepID=F4PHT9_CACFS|nr:uncharacterized protein DFA_03521 [Cavenderia fasciculata]EGG25273.1 hypothetical protein DFA_03521 [Cavenderia fasciculata]|eukprot:XP_004363124.1 hypothetical protein DFA_03521 [Cavenderia fasciculata]
MGRRSLKPSSQHYGSNSNTSGSSGSSGKGGKSNDEQDNMIILPRCWDYFIRFKDPFIMPFQSYTIEIKQSSKGPRVGSTVWDASIVMSKYFDSEIGSKALQGKRVIELGAGVGLLGISLSLMGADITLTDQQSMHEILNLNVRTNCLLTKTKVAELWWGNDVTDFHPPFDMIVGSDLMYEDDCVDLLLASLLDLSSFHPKKVATEEEEGYGFHTNIHKKKQPDSKIQEEEQNDSSSPSTTSTTTNNNNNNNNNDINSITESISNVTIQEQKEEEQKEEENDKPKEKEEEAVAEEPLYMKSSRLQAADTVIYLGYENRSMSAESLFMSKVTQFFNVEMITTSHLSPGFKNIDVRILKMTRKDYNPVGHREKRKQKMHSKQFFNGSNQPE